MSFPARAALALSLLVAPLGATRAQNADPVDELIRAVLNDVGGLKFADAIRSGHAILGAASALHPAQEATLRFAMAAAFYPEFEGVQRPDSALAQLVRVVRVAPDAELPIVLAWPGLDSLFALARMRTLAVVMRPASDSFAVVNGAPVALPVIASRPVRFRLSTRRIGGAEVTHMESSTPSATVELSLRAADGGRVLLERGEYELIVTAIDASGDSVRYARRMQVDGAAPTLLPVPQLDSARLRPETRESHPWRTAAVGGGMALATFVIADGMRATGNIATATTSDSRAGLIGLSMLASTGWAIWKDRDGTDEDAVQANQAVRSLHERSVSAANAENARRLAAHRVTVKFVGEGR